MSSLKSGVVHDPMPVSDIDTQLATLQGMKESKEWEGLFDTDKSGGYVAPHHCDLEPTGEMMMIKNDDGKPVFVKSYTVMTKTVDGKASKRVRHFMGVCKQCSKTSVERVIV